MVYITRNLPRSGVFGPTMNSSRILLLSSLSTLALAACGGGSTSPADGVFLPDSATLYLPTPEETGSSGQGLTATGGQGLCASDTRAYDEVMQRISEHNDEIATYVNLLQALKRQAARQLEATGSYERTVTSSAGRSLTLVATVEADDSLTYSATFTGPEHPTHTFLVGSTAPDRLSGSWTFVRVDGTDRVSVSWQKSGEDELTVTRTTIATGATAVYHRTGDAVSVTFTGRNTTAIVTWSAATKAGSISINENAELCWDEALCTTACR